MSANTSARPLPLRTPGCPYRPAPEIADLAPVEKVLCPTGIAAWLVTGYDDVREVLGDPARFSSASGQFGHVLANQPPDAPLTEGAFHRMDGADHLRFRRLLAPAISTPKRIEQFRAGVERVVHERLDALATSGPPVDLHVEFSHAVTTAVLADLLAVPAELFQKAAQTLFDSEVDRASLIAVMAEVVGYVTEVVQARRAAPGDDVVSVLIERGGALNDTELVNMIVGLVLAGLDTMATAISYAVVLLLDHPEDYAALGEDPGLVPGAVEELLRYTSNGSGTLRVAAVDTELAGVPIAAGEYVIAAAHAANFDPRHFTDPDRLDIRRGRNPHIGFGHGPHQCVAQQLARLEMVAALGALTRRVPTLRLAVPFEEIEFKYQTPMGGPARLPVTWDRIEGGLR
ncbi:cytochrome P450 [Allokutzneria oryzae]|uniref:Cytochrome P450 n=1 Tax=Allokutzneria oryzae TaxID=1378989 RepID=A0ABV5ZXH6_9PSEU